MRSSSNRTSGDFNPAAARAAAGSAVPAPGYRDYGRTGYEGDVRSIGNEGSVWSGTAESGSTNAFRLLFICTSMVPENGVTRGHGFQVRCLQAFIAQDRFLFLLETDLLIFGTTETACVFPECFRPDWSCKQSETINSAAH